MSTRRKLLNNLRVDEQRRFWIAYSEVDEDVCDIREDLGQEGMEVKIVLPMSHNILTRTEEYEKFKREIAQLELSDLTS